MIDHSHKVNPIIPIIFTLFFIGVLFLGVISWFQVKEGEKGIVDELKLKSTADNIIQFTEYDQFGRPLPAPTPEEGDNIVKYMYVTDEEIELTTYKGLSEDVSKRTPSAQVFLKDRERIDDERVKETYVTKIYSGINFNQRGNKWYQTEVATTTKTAFLLQTKPTVLTKAKELLGQPALADTYFAGAGDGQILKGNSDVWSTTHDAVTGQSADYTSTTAFAQSAIAIITGNFNISRLFLPFDTSAISAGSNITAATVNVYITNRALNDDDGNDYINVVQTTQPNSSQLATADYDLCGTVSNPTTGATAIDFTAGFTTSAYNAFTLNATGITWIAKNGVSSSCGGGTGVTCLGLREGHDLVNSVFDGTLANFITISTSEETGTSQDPYLEITSAAVVYNKASINGGTFKVNGGSLKIN